MACLIRNRLVISAGSLIRPFSYGSALQVKHSIPETIDHETGLAKAELDAQARGIDNPFDMRVYKRNEGDETNPTLIPSFNKSRIIGCVCEEDSTRISWMWLSKDEIKRCECGYYFKLVDAKPI